MGKDANSNTIHQNPDQPLPQVTTLNTCNPHKALPGLKTRPAIIRYSGIGARVGMNVFELWHPR